MYIWKTRSFVASRQKTIFSYKNCKISSNFSDRSILIGSEINLMLFIKEQTCVNLERKLFFLLSNDSSTSINYFICALIVWQMNDIASHTPMQIQQRVWLLIFLRSYFKIRFFNFVFNNWSKTRHFCATIY